MNNRRKGIRYEQEVVRKARAQGLISFRSAASNSPVDVCIIDKQNKIVTFVQCKNTKVKFKNKGDYLEGIEDDYTVVWKIMHKNWE